MSIQLRLGGSLALPDRSAKSLMVKTSVYVFVFWRDRVFILRAWMIGFYNPMALVSAKDFANVSAPVNGSGEVGGRQCLW